MTGRARAALVVALGTALAVLAPPAAQASDPAPVWGVDQARTADPFSQGPPPAGVEEVADGSTAAATTATASTWTLSGAGWGHGVGMSQYGAMEMAKDGRTAAQILGHYYTGTGYEAVADRQILRVNLLHQVGSVSLAVSSLAAGSGGLKVTIGGVSTTGAPGASASITRSGSGVKLTCTSCSPSTTLTGPSAALYWDDDKTLLSVGGTPYRDGTLLVTPTPSASTLEAVARVRIHDQYLDYIREVPWSWPVAALEAQAAAARGFALSAYAGGVRSACNCHVYDTVASQVFGGYPATASEKSAWADWRAAVRATGSTSTGYVVTYGGSIIESVYSSSTGGRTQNSEDVWVSALPYLRSVDDHWSLRSSNPNRSWVSTPSRTTLAGAFGLADVTRLDLSSRYESGAVRTATATASDGSRQSLSGASLASRLGLKSSYVQRPTTRYGGATRYAAAAAVAASHVPSATTVVIASGEDRARADSAVSGPLAQALGAPLLLSTGTSLPSATRTELSRRSGTLTSAVVVGGPASVSPDVVDALAARGLSVTRIGGSDRYAVSAAVARRVAAERSVGAAVVASGTALADALGAGGPAGRLGEPVLLTRGTDVPPTVQRAISDLGISAVRIVGGTASVSTEVEIALTDDVGSTRRIGGANRYAVAANVTTFYRSRLPSAGRVTMASGEDAALTDALTAGSLGHLTLLLRSTDLPSQSRVALQRSGDVGRLLVVGGTTSVPAAVLTAAARA